MAEFITTTKISFFVEKLIEEAESFIIWVTPFIQVHERLKKIIERKLKDETITMYVVCRKNELQQSVELWLASLNIQIFNCDNLHAKCYLNENIALVTSMNLYHYSMVNNIEFGIIVNKSDDIKNYSSILEECRGLSILELQVPCVVDVIDIINSIKATDLELVPYEDNSRFLHFKINNLQYLPVKINDQIPFYSEKGLITIEDILNNYSIVTRREGNKRKFEVVRPPLSFMKIKLDSYSDCIFPQPNDI